MRLVLQWFLQVRGVLNINNSKMAGKDTADYEASEEIAIRNFNKGVTSKEALSCYKVHNFSKGSSKK